MDGHRLAVILTTMSREHSKRGETACRTKEAVVLEVTEHRGVRDHVHQDQFRDARRTTHHSHAYRAPPVSGSVDIHHAMLRYHVTLWITWAPVCRPVWLKGVLHLIKMWLDCPVEETDDRGRKTRTTEARNNRRGIPQGSPS